MADAPKSDPATRLWVSFKSDQHPIPEKLARELAALVIEWSGFESAVDLDSLLMRRFPVVQKLFAEEPRNFKRKIESWKEAVHALFPDDEGYKNIATLICGEGKTVAHYRHALIHNRWQPPDKPGEPFSIWLAKPLDKLPAGHRLEVTPDLAAAVHQRLRQLSDTLWGFTANRMLHGRLRRKSAPPGPKP